MAVKPVLSIGLNSKGKVIEIRVKGKKQQIKTNSKHKCAPGTKTVILRLKFCAPSEKSTYPRPGTGGATPPCCMVAGGRLICWPPCV